MTLSDINFIGERNPAVKDVRSILERHPGPMATHLRRRTLGSLDIEQVYIYPPMEGAARRAAARIRIIGVKKITRGTLTEDAPEELGYVEGFIGEPEFNTKLATLIRSKFGSPEQFATSYPRVIFEEV